MKSANERKSLWPLMETPPSVWLLASCSPSHSNSLTKRMSFAPCTNGSSCAKTRNPSSPSSGKVWVSVASATSCGSTATTSCKNDEQQMFMMRLVGGHSSDSSLAPQATVLRKPRLAQAGQESVFIRARDIAAPAHLAALTAAKPRILAMIQDGVTPGLLPEHPLEERLNTVITTAISTYLAALYETDQATANLFIQKATQATDEAWKHTAQRQQGPSVPSPTIAALEQPGSASQEEDSDDMDFSAPRKSRINTPQLQAQLSRLTDRTRLRHMRDTLRGKGVWQQVTRIEDLCHTHVSHKWLYHLDACAGSVPHST